MWDNAFDEDDPLNPKLADEYGIVMGTSHHEPMMRAQKEWKRHGTGPWDYTTNSQELRRILGEGMERNKNYESIITLGMRGDGDKPMAGRQCSQHRAAGEDCRRPTRDHRRSSEPRSFRRSPGLGALQGGAGVITRKGMRVPDDVTLLWCDDNWGNLRRLPTAEERKRSGGAGIYYHFDYVGGPRSYKWLNTNPITKVWEQMNLAHQYGANRIWIVNVGDLKPMEFPIEFFLDFARNPEALAQGQHLRVRPNCGPSVNLGRKHAAEIADIIARYTKYNGRRKPELLDPNTFSLVELSGS